MTLTIVGKVCDNYGFAMRDDAWLDPDNPRRAFHERKVWATPANEYRNVQPVTIPLDLDHAEVVGEVKYLERDAGGLTAVATSDADELADVAADQDVYYSAEYRHTDYHDAELTGLALTFSPASIGLRPVAMVRAPLRDAAAYAGRNDWLRQRVQRAADYDRHRGWREPHVIGTEPAYARHNESELLLEQRRASVPLEYRSASAADVHHRQRVVEIVACPAETPAPIFEGDRPYLETFAHGAFAGEEHRAERVKVNRDHNLQRTIGRCQRLDPYSHRGLVAELKIAASALGDETMALCEIGALDASVAFGVPAGGESWDGFDRRRRRITKAFLGHIALVPDPAYETANLIAVRSTR